MRNHIKKFCKKFDFKFKPIEQLKTVLISNQQSNTSQVETPVTSNQKRKSSINVGDKRYQCPYCDSSFTRMNNVKDHVKVKHNESYDTTDFSQTSYIVSEKFIDMVSKNSIDDQLECKPFSCNYCGLSFKEVVQLVEHMNIHETETVENGSYILTNHVVLCIKQ